MKNYRRQIEFYLYRRGEIKTSQKRSERAWSNVIEYVIKKYDETELRRFITFKYQLKMTSEELCREFNISETTYGSWNNKIINDIALYAAQKRLIKPFE